MLVYLALASPFEDPYLNFLEFANELCIYFTLLMLLALNIFSNQVFGSKLDQIGNYLILYICLNIFLNIFVMCYALIKTFKELMNDRNSKSVGRCLRYCCKVKLPERTQCFCNCCPCGDEAKELNSAYPRSTFFSI